MYIGEYIYIYEFALLFRLTIKTLLLPVFVTYIPIWNISYYFFWSIRYTVNIKKKLMCNYYILKNVHIEVLDFQLTNFLVH